MRVAIIGTGCISSQHINALKLCNQEIVALCDIDTEKCENSRETYGLNARIYADYKSMLSNEKPDAVHICTPHYLHAEMICECLRRNVNVLCEKPLAISTTQLNDINQAIKTTNAQLGVCFQNRFNAAVLYIKDFLKGKTIKAASANLVWNRDAAYYAQGEWRGTKDQEGGGVMINQAIHGLDLLQWVCGMPESVIAYTHNVSLKNVIEVEDTAFGLFKLKNGGNFIVNATNAAKYTFPVYYTFRTENDTVEFSADSIIINGRFITKSDGSPVFGKEVWGTGHIHLIKNFYDCLETGEKFSIDFEEAKKTVQLILAMYASDGNEIGIV